MPGRDYYKILQVDPEAEVDVIRAAYETLSTRFDPKRDLTGVHEIRLRELDRAFETLSDEGRRRVYDIERAGAYEPVAPGEMIGIPVEQPVGAEMLAPSLAPAARTGLSSRLNGGAADHLGAAVGAVTLDFGRFAGRTLRDVAVEDVEYLRWLSRHSSGIRFRSEIERLLRSLGQAL
ncbi:MAG TPA: DnaJ domain-containing protein [Candidatus Limnocylindria bacterium]